MSGEKVRFCTFCGKSHHEVNALVEGPDPNVAICNNCVELAMYIVLNKKYERIDEPEVVDNNKDT